MGMRPEAEDQFFFSRSSRPPSNGHQLVWPLGLRVLVKSKKKKGLSPGVACNNCFLEHVPSRSLNLGLADEIRSLCGEERRRVPMLASS